jgi:hypothetical protein
MNPNWKAGEPVKAKSTMMNRRCGIISEQAWGHVCFVDQRDISFYLQKTTFAGAIEAQCDLETFAMNFEHDRFQLPNHVYSKTAHFKRKFPTEFFV